MTATYDLLVVGGDEASLCAAACAARSGARAGLLRPAPDRKRRPGGSVPPVPNFVWRRLDLQDYGLALEPVSARVTLMPEGESMTTYAGARQTDAALEAMGMEDHLLWSSFIDDMARLKDAAPLCEAPTAEVNGASPAKAFLADARQLSALGQIAGSCADLLDDYFADPRLKTHLAAHALAVTGLGGREPGTALALPECLDENAWRARGNEGDPSLASVLEKVCEESGVVFHQGALLAVSSDGGKYKTVDVTGDEKLKARTVFFATPEAAAIAGVDAPFSPLGVCDKVTAELRIKLKKSFKPPAGDARAVFQIVDNVGELQSARDSAADGRLPDPLPVEFEFAEDGDLIARTSYCPKAFRADDEWRGWTGQDRQAVAAQITMRLASRMKELPNAIKNTKIRIIGADAHANGAKPAAPADLVIVQPDRHNAIGAAVKLADEVLGND